VAKKPNFLDKSCCFITPKGDITMDIGLKIRRLKETKKHTLKDLEDVLNINPSNLSKIERGSRKPSIEMLESLSDFYQVPITYFFNYKVPNVRGLRWNDVVNMFESKGFEPEEVLQIFQSIEIIHSKMFGNNSRCKN
jgi:transcriptional regulator with XRE-family HTH domain